MSHPSRGYHPEFEALRREYNDFRYFLPDALVEVNLDSLQVLYLNRQAELMFGYSAGDVAGGLSGSALVAADALPGAIQLLQRYVSESRATGAPYTRSGTVEIFEHLLRRKDGSSFWAESQTAFVLDDRGVPVRMLTIIRDVSARKLLEAARQPLVDGLRADNEDR